MKSTVNTTGSLGTLWLPALSISTTVMLCGPSGNSIVGENVHSPSGVISVVPNNISPSNTSIVLPASPFPFNVGFVSSVIPFGAIGPVIFPISSITLSITGLFGAVVSITFPFIPPSSVAVATFPAVFVTVAVTEYFPSGNSVGTSTE